MTEIVPVLSTCTVEWMYVKFPPDFTNDPWFTNRSNPPPDVPCMYALTKFHEPSLVTTAASSNVTTDEASWPTVPVFVNPTPLMIGVTKWTTPVFVIGATVVSSTPPNGSSPPAGKFNTNGADTGTNVPLQRHPATTRHRMHPRDVTRLVHTQRQRRLR